MARDEKRDPPLAERGGGVSAAVQGARRGPLADPATVTASVTLPDGTTSSPTPTQVGPGVWEVLYTTSQAGRHTLAVTGSGGDLGTIVVKHDDVINAEAT